MGGKTSTSTQSTSIPADVLSRYNSVNAQAQQTASQPFQDYSGQFVAPVNSTEQSGISQTSAAANEAQPYYGAATSTLNNANSSTQPYYGAATGLAQGAYSGAQGYNSAATGLTAASAGAVNAQPLNVAQYESPYIQEVAESQEQLLNQQNQQQMSGELGNVINSGAFGGDRAGIDMDVLSQQRALANNSVLSNILNTGYNTALSTAQQQQGVNLSAAQANRSALGAAGSQLANIGQQEYTQGMGESSQLATLGQDIYGQGAATSSALANLGTGAQSAALSGAQAELSAGQVAQTTQQAQDTAEYNQFLQQQSYPFQVDQFLANIAEGTGALSGSTTTTTQPGSLFSDERLKENIRKVGKLHDGQAIYAYNYKGDNVTHVGLLAQEVEKKHPDAVGLARGFKTVDYDKATSTSARPRRYAGGLVPANDRDGYDAGGSAGYDPQLMAEILSNAHGMYGPYASTQPGGSAASASGGPYGASSHVPAANLPVGHLQSPGALPQRRSGLSQINDAAQFGQNAVKTGQALGAAGQKFADRNAIQAPTQSPDVSLQDAAAPPPANLDTTGDMNLSDLSSDVGTPSWRGGARVRRYACGGLAGYADGGDVDDDPYGGGLSGAPALSIPNQSPTAKLPSQSSLSGGGNQSAQDAADIMKAVQAAAQVAAMFRRGGRIGKDGGGPVDGDDDQVDFAQPDADAGGAPQVKAIWTDNGTPILGTGRAGGAPQKPDVFDHSDPYDVLPPISGKHNQLNYNDPALYDTHQGRTQFDEVARGAHNALNSVGYGAYDAASGLANGVNHFFSAPVTRQQPTTQADVQSAFDSAPPQSQRLAAAPPLAAPQAARHTARPPAPSSSPSPGGLAPIQAPTPLANDPSSLPKNVDDGDISVTPDKQVAMASPLDQAQSAASGVAKGASHFAHEAADTVGSGLGRYGSALKRGDPATWASLLSGFAAMEAAPTVHPFAAISQGLGAAGQEYLNASQQQAQTQAERANTWSQLSTKGGSRATMVPSTDKGAIGIPGQPGTYKWAPLPWQGSGQQPASAPRYLGGSGVPAAQTAAMDWAATGDDHQRAADSAHITQVVQDGVGARTNLQTLYNYAGAVASPATADGFMQTGALQPVKLALVSRWNDVMRSTGNAKGVINPDAETNAQILDKMATVAARDATEHGGQTSLGAFHQNMEAVASGHLTRDAGIHMLAQTYIANQHAADQAGYYSEAGDVGRQLHGQPNGFNTSDIDTAFTKDFSPTKYLSEQAALESMLKDGSFVNVLNSVKSGKIPDNSRFWSALDSKYKTPGLHRYFTGQN